MRKNTWFKWISALFAVATVWISVIIFTIVTLAGTSGTLPNGLSYGSETGTATWTFTENSIIGTATAKSGTDNCGNTNYSSVTGTITITNTSGEDRTLVLDGSIVNNGDGKGTITLAGSAYSGGTVTMELAAGDSFVIGLTTSNAENTVSISLTIANFTSGGDVSIDFVPVSGVEYTANGTLVNSATVTITDSVVNGITIKPSSSQYQFTEAIVEYDDGTTAHLKSDASGKIYPTKAGVVTPVFIYDENGIAPFLVNGSTYWSWESAFNAAGSSGTVIVNDNYILPAGNYSVPSGVTLLVPYNSDNTLRTTTPVTTTSGTTFISLTTPAWVKPTIYRKLTLESGANIVVNGAISLSGAQCSAQRSNGMPTGAVSMIDMKSGSSITVNSGANLYAWGYITGSGTVLIKSGGTVYEDFQVRDWRGGTAASAMLNKDQKVFPVSQYYVQNIEVAMTLEAGAYEYGYMSLVASKKFADATIPFIGSNGMFRLSSGSLTKDYIESEDRLQVTINGDLAMSSLVINVSGYNMDSSKYVLPINNNLIINVNQGTTTISQDMAFQPGSEVFVSENATVKLASGVSLFVYDADEWNGQLFVYSACDYAPLAYVACNLGAPNARPTIDDVKITVNGTLDASEGYLYTTAGGANICSTNAGTIICGTAGTQETTYQATQSGTDITFVSINTYPASLKNSDGRYITSGANTYTYVNGYWRCAEHDYNAGIITTEPTCFQEGVRTFTCNVCAHEYTEVIAATGAHTDTDADGYCDMSGCTYEFQVCAHTNTTVLEAVAPTCTTTGLTEGLKCNDCDRTLTLQEEVSALGHDYGSTITKNPTCEETGERTYTCTRCGDSYAEGIVANGHSYDEGVLTTNPTCTEDGEMTYTCSACEDSYTTPVNPLGHDHSVACYSVESSWHKCSRCEGTTEAVARQYTVIFQSYADDVNVTMSGTYAYGSTVTAPVLNSNCFDLSYSWSVVSEGVLDWAEVANANLIDITNGDNTITVPGNISIDGVKSGAISMSVKYAENSESSGTLLTVYVLVNCDASTQVTASFPNESELVVSGGKVPGVNSYQFEIDLTAEQLLCQDKLTVSFGEEYKQFDKNIAALLFAYSNALNNSVDLDGESAQAKELVAASLAYGAAVQEYFYSNPNYIITESKPNVTATNAYNQLVVSGNATMNGETPIASFKSARVSFGLEYMIRYAYKINLPEGATATKVGVIITDTDNQLNTTAKWDGTTGQWHGTHGTDTNGRNLSTFDVAATELSDHYATVYVEYTDAEGNACYAYSTTLKYGVTTYLNREIYKATTAADYETNQELWKYVNLLNSLLEIANLVEKSGSNV